MVFCIGGDKHPRSNTPVEHPEGENIESWEYSTHHCGITEKNCQPAIERHTVIAVALSVANSRIVYSRNTFVESK